MNPSYPTRALIGISALALVTLGVGSGYWLARRGIDSTSTSSAIGPRFARRWLANADGSSGGMVRRAWAKSAL